MIDVNLDIAIQYANDVIDGTRPNCNYTKLACKRFLTALENTNYYYDSDAVNEVVDFIQQLELCDDFAGEPYVIYDWLYLVLCSTYGIKIKATGKRVYSRINITVPRKNSKSQFVSALAIYHLIYDEQQEILLGANAMKQAKEINFSKIKDYARQLDPKGKRIKQYYDFIKYKKSKIIALASDSKTIDGKSAGVAILDETENFKDSSLYDVIVSSTGARKNGVLIYTIGTAGSSTNCYGYQLYEYSTKLLKEEIIDDSYFTIIFGLDESDSKNWDTIEAARKANPMFDYISSLPEFFEQQLVTAKNDKIFAHGFKVKNLNIWQQSTTVYETYIEDSVVVGMMEALDFPEGKEIYWSFDLGANRDISVITCMWIEESIMYFKNKYYLPEANLNSIENQKRYCLYSTDGFLTLTPGNVCDYGFIYQEIIDISERNEVQNLFYDSWNGLLLITDLTNYGINCVPYSMGNKALNTPTKELYRLALNGNIKIDLNDCTRWMFANAYIKETGNNNIRPAKRKKEDKIDVLSSMLCVIGGYMQTPYYGGAGVF